MLLKHAVEWSSAPSLLYTCAAYSRSEYMLHFMIKFF